MFNEASPPAILIVTRKWHGIGGMQRLSRDLCQEATAVYGNGVRCCYPHSDGVTGLMSMGLRSCISAFTLRGTNPRIHVCDASLLPLGSMLRRISSGQLSVTACGLDVTYQALWYEWLMRYFLGIADVYVAISHATAAELVKRGVQKKKIIVIPCGVSPGATAVQEPVTDDRLLLTVGRLIPRKGTAWFLSHVFPRILQEMPDVRYVIAGSGPEEEHIRLIIKQLNLGNSVELKTDCSDKQRDELLSGAAVFVVPNIPVSGDIEGFGIACIEAAVRGTPVAAAHLEGLRDAVIDGETGRFFEPADAASCMETVLSLLHHPLSRSAVSSSALQHYGWDVVFPMYRRHVFEA